MVQTPVGAQFVLVFPSNAKPVPMKYSKKVFTGYLRLEEDDFCNTEFARTDVCVELDCH